MAEQKNRPQKQRNARGMVAAGVVGTILPSDLAIPRWVAPLQSPAPFHQATYSLASTTCFGAELPSAREVQNRHKRLPGLAVENRHQAPTGSVQETSELSRSTNRNPWYNRSLTPAHYQTTVGFEALRECRFSSAARHITLRDNLAVELAPRITQLTPELADSGRRHAVPLGGRAGGLIRRQS